MKAHGHARVGPRISTWRSGTRSTGARRALDSKATNRRRRPSAGAAHRARRRTAGAGRPGCPTLGRADIRRPGASRAVVESSGSLHGGTARMSADAGDGKRKAALRCGCRPSLRGRPAGHGWRRAWALSAATVDAAAIARGSPDQPHAAAAGGQPANAAGAGPPRPSGPGARSG